MKNCILFVILWLFIPHCIMSQHMVFGYVHDANSGEVLIGANVYFKKSEKGTATTTNGYYQMQSKQNDTLRVSYVGYQEKYIPIYLSNDTLINIYLTNNNKLDELKVVANKRIESFNRLRLTPEEINFIPSLTGKPDVMKTLQLLPGILTMNEGSGTILVRGGDPGQNLYLLDKVPLIYVHHLGGFMSVFNPDMINSMDVYKGAFPAKYGGKLSSVIDITQREGNKKRKLSSLSIGLTDLSYTTEGPFNKWKNASYLFTGRKTLFEPFLYLASKLDAASDYSMIYGFHDLNGKISWLKDEKNQFYFNIYHGDDYLRYKGDNYGMHLYKNVWGNWMLSSRWNHIFNSGLLTTMNLSFNRYRLKDITEYEMSNLDETYLSSYRSIVTNTMFKTDWSYTVSSFWQLNFGLHNTVWIFKPNKYANSLSYVVDESQTVQYDNALYFDNTLKIDKWASINLGTRLLTLFGANFSYYNFEPRLQATIHLPLSQNINISYMGITQNSHLLFTPGDIMQNEIWVPSDATVPVAKANQYTIGWMGNFSQNKYKFEVNYYKKYMTNLVAYKEGYAFMSGDVAWKNKLENNGKGESKGIEFMMTKTRGKMSGFINYAYANTTRQFNKINQGKTYVYEYDRPHTATVSVHQRITSKISFNTLWVYKTGLPYTPAIARQYTPTIDSNTTKYYEALVYGERNSERLAAYHRLDLSLSYETKTKRKNKCIWTFSLYNAYARQNPHHYYYNINESDEIIKSENVYSNQKLNMYQISYFPFIPSISYKVFFDKDSKQNRKHNRLSIKR